MPQRHFALESGGPPRLEVAWGADEGSFDVRLDGAPIGTLRGADELRNGKSLALPAGGEIFVRWEDATRGPRVERDGTQIPEDERPRHLRSAIYCVYFVGGAHILVALADRILPGTAPWPHAIQIGFGATMLGLGALAQRGKHIALTVALALHIGAIVLALRSGAFPFIPIGLAFAMGWGVRAAKALDVPVLASSAPPYR
jgi:hypothetical protein